MTVVDLERELEELEAESWRAGDTDIASDDAAAPEPSPPTARAHVDARALLATALTTASAALVIGGIFDSWLCRVIGVVAAVAGTAAVAVTIRSRRQVLAQIVSLVALAVAAAFTLSGSSESPSNLPAAVRAAVDAGRLLQPPVPFDAGWRPLVFGLVAMIALGAGWLATAMSRRLVGALLPLPVALLASFTQPPGQEALTAAFIFLPVLGAMGVLFTAGEPGQRTDVRFEIRRAAKAGALVVPALVLLLLFNSASFLFPAPAYDPNDKPQKPRSIPPSEAIDRILFSVEAPEGFTGPWRMGALDIYDDGAFLLPPRAKADLATIPASGEVSDLRASDASVRVVFTTGDLGNTPVLPGVPTQVRVRLPASAPRDIGIDTRTGVMRVASGRAPAGLRYEVDLPPYPSAEQLADAVPQTKGVDSDHLVVPSRIPPAVQRILRAAPAAGWARLDYVRRQLLDNITASGPGAQVSVDAARVQDMLDGSRKASPFEIVAAEVLLARWAGFPARVGFGFNQFHVENGRSVVRPDNAAQWLEVNLAGRGWLPLLAKPPQADSTLEQKDADADIVASNDVAVALFLPVGLPKPVPLFELVRARILQALPLVVAVLLGRAVAPAATRLVRRRRRERWADERGPRARIAVAYAEFRDTATDLNVGDPFATPIEYLDRVVPDDDHTELAWLVSRTMYGDLAVVASEKDASLAEELSASLQARLRSGQAPQVRAAALLTQASLRAPYTTEVPNLTLPAPGQWVMARINVVRHAIALRRRRRRLAREAAGRTIRLRLGGTR